MHGMSTATDDLQHAMRSLEAAAYDLATGRTEPLHVLRLLDAVYAAPLRGGTALLTVLRTTAPRLAFSTAARKQFFHAARALVTLHRPL